jgi:hypothetical protein
MDPLDLTVTPPRSPYQMLEGLYMLPRTIDKLRAKLPGGIVNEKLAGRRIEDFLALVPIEKAEQIYPAMRHLPKTTRTFDLLLQDDGSLRDEK